MLDPFVLLAIPLLLPVVALSGFVGCAALLDLDDVKYTVAVTVTPDKTDLEPGQSKIFTAKVNLKKPDGTDDTAGVTWSNNTTDQTKDSAKYTAPALFVPGTKVTITATSVTNTANKAEATVTHIPATIAPPPVVKLRINCGGPQVLAAPIPWEADRDFNLGTPQRFPVDAAGPSSLPLDEVYLSWRQGATDKTFSYDLTLDEGDYAVTLKCALISDNVNFKGKFRVTLAGQPAKTIFVDFTGKNIGDNLDRTEPVHVDNSKKLTITFEGGANVSGTFAFVNAIEIEQN